MRIGIIETGRPPAELQGQHGDYPAMFARLFEGLGDKEFVTYAIESGAPLPDITACNAFIITGSRHAVYEDHPWLEPLFAFIRACVTANVPLLGICFGHQAMAQALGGRVEKSSRGWGVGVQEYALAPAGQALMPSFEKLHLLGLHQDQVVVPPPGAQLLASSDFCPYAGFAYGDTALSFQAHPEFSLAYERDLIALRRGNVLSFEVADRASASLDRPVDAAALAVAAGKFLQQKTRRI